MAKWDALTIESHGEPVPFGDCPSGLFMYEFHLGFKSASGDAYHVGLGDAFWSWLDERIDRSILVVQPCTILVASVVR